MDCMVHSTTVRYRTAKYITGVDNCPIVEQTEGVTTILNIRRPLSETFSGDMHDQGRQETPR
jgi:hypothetical protein